MIYGVQTPLLSAIDTDDVGDAGADVSLHMQTSLSDSLMALLYRLYSITSSPNEHRGHQFSSNTHNIS